ncbi:MAG TPA: PAS domain-containing protein [Pseudolabrys sp.]|nr:PAS domain-containing protein [Pseudolabrys sp.]
MARDVDDTGKLFLDGGGLLGAIIAGFDWSRTPLGPIESWPTSIKTTVGLILRSPVPIVTLWGEAGIMIYNDAYSGFAGGRHPQLLGSEVRKGWPEVADFNDNVMRVGLAGGTLSYQDQELTLLRSGVPEQVWMNLDYSPVIGEDGKPIGVIAIVVETSEQVKNGRRLRANEARLKFLDELSKATAAYRDADAVMGVTTRMIGEYLGVSNCAYADMDDDQDGFTIRGDWAAPGAQHTLGHYSLADFGKRAVADLRAGRPLVVNDNQKELAPEEAAAFQAIGIGSTVCMPLVKDGRLTALMAIHHQGPHLWSSEEQALLAEVTERSWAHIERVRAEADTRRAEREYREKLAREVADRTADFQQSEKNLRTVFETSYMHQGLLTTDGMIVYVNATALAAIERRLEDVVGMDFADSPWFSGTPGMRRKVRECIARAAAGEHVQMPISIDVTGGRRVFEFSLRPAYDEAGTVVALVPEAVEVTARVRAEEALQQAIKVEAIGNLTGGIAHDFNNLLMAVLGSLELLRKRMPSDPALMRLVDNAAEGARRGKSLTERMLAFARKQDLKPEKVDLTALVGGMAELMARALGPTITVHIELDDNLPPVEIDPNQLEAALLNLAVNARDAMRGEGPIVIAARRGGGIELPGRIKPGPYVCLSVADAGEGMDEATLRKATEPFFTTKGLGKGTGLGLSMVHGLAEQSGGTLVLKSTVGVGTTAEIWLPAVLPSAAERPENDRLAASLPAPMEMSSRLRILAVDDDSLVLMNTVEMLEDLGHSVVAATSARQALEHIKTSDFDLVITDHAMPHVTGEQLIKELAGLRPGLPIILATGYAELPAGTAVDVPRLRKPYSQAELADAVARHRHGAASLA